MRAYLNSDLIYAQAGVLDNNPDKVDKRLYGHDLWVFSPSTIASVDRPVVVLRTGVYDDEIAKQLLDINPAVIILRSNASRTSVRHKSDFRDRPALLSLDHDSSAPSPSPPARK